MGKKLLLMFANKLSLVCKIRLFLSELRTTTARAARTKNIAAIDQIDHFFSLSFLSVLIAYTLFNLFLRRKFLIKRNG